MTLPPSRPQSPMTIVLQRPMPKASRLLAVVALLSMLSALRAAGSPVDTSSGDMARQGTDTTLARSAESGEAAYRFALAKMLSEQGDYEAAGRAFARAGEVDPEDPYFHLELAKFESYLVQVAREPRQRRDHLERALAAAERARALAPENLDVLGVHARLLLQVGEQDPEALARAQTAYETLRSRTAGDLQVLTSLGQLYLWRGEHAKAAEVLEEAARYRPGHRLIQSMWVEALLGSEDYSAAEVALADLIEIEPTSVEHRLRLAQLLGRRGAHDRAAEVLRAAPEEVRDNLRLRHHLARELFLLGEAEDSLEQIDFLLLDLPEDEKLRRLRLAVLPAAGRFEEAIRELRALSATGEGEHSLQDALLLSRLLERAGRGDEAASQLRREIDRREGEERLQLVVTLAGVLERADDASAAVAVLEQAFDAAPPPQAMRLAEELVEVLHRRGEDERAFGILSRLRSRLDGEAQHAAALSRLKILELALLADADDWNRVLDEAPELFTGQGDAKAGSTDTAMTARFLHADALAELDRLDEAVSSLAAAADGDNGQVVAAKQADLLFTAGRDDAAWEVLAPWRDSQQVDDRLFVARVLQRSERYAESLRFLEPAIAAEPERTDLLFLLGAAYERSGQTSAAVETFRRILEIQPAHAPAMNYLGYMWAERREALPAALDLIRRAVALDPENGAYLDSLGWAYYQLGRYEEARGPLEWAARLVPEDPTVFEHLGDLYVELEEVDLARSSYRAALRLDADNAEELTRKLEGLGTPVSAGGGSL